MERRKFLTKAVLATAGLTTVLFARGPRAGSRRGGRGTGTGGTTTPTPTPIAITEAQKEELLFIYQEEKVARDVYITLGLLYPGENTFANIQLSEQKHIDAAQTLCETYGIDISNVNEQAVGNFVLPELQDLYDTMVARGNESLIDALEVGVDIEVTDIADLEQAIQDMSELPDVVRVFTSLREGSINHLAAFENALARATR